MDKCPVTGPKEQKEEDKCMEGKRETRKEAGARGSSSAFTFILLVSLRKTTKEKYQK